MSEEVEQLRLAGDEASAWTISPWSDRGTATFAARGRTRQQALEAALSAALALAIDREGLVSGGEGSRATPLRGEGVDLGDLLADMLDEFWDAVALHGEGIAEVVIDGLLRRDDGGLLAWGYAVGSMERGVRKRPPRLASPPEVVESTEGVLIRGRLTR